MSRVRGAFWIVAVVAGCSGRALVPDEADDDDGAEGIGSLAEDGEAGDVDDGADEGDTGSIDCVPPQAPEVTVSVWPGGDPVTTDEDVVLAEVTCEIEDRIGIPGGIELYLFCDERGPLDERIVISVAAPGIAMPADLGSGAVVQVRLFAWVDAENYEQYWWRRADHFALYQAGELVLAGGSGLSFPSNENGDNHRTFFDPVYPTVEWSDCPGPDLACHEIGRGAWVMTVGDEVVVSPPFAVVHVGGFEVHLGEAAISDAADCGEPSFARIAFAIVRS